MKNKQDVEKRKAHKVLWKLKSEIEDLKMALLDKDVITPKVAQEKFEKLYAKYQKPLPPGEPWRTLFDKEILSFFVFLKENRSDIFETSVNAIWDTCKDNVLP